MGGSKNQLKEKIHNLKFRRVKTWVLIIVLIPLLFLDATLLRLDHLKMVELRTAVLDADAAGDDAQIAATLEALKDFTFHNIVVNVVEENGSQSLTFGTGVFYLEHQYQRAAEAALAEAEAQFTQDGNPYGNIYAEASAICSPQAIQNGWAWNDPEYINCMMTEINKYPASSNLVDQLVATLPSTELYRKNYASPVWAPTWSGFAILLTIIIFVVILIRFCVWVTLNISLLATKKSKNS